MLLTQPPSLTHPHSSRSWLVTDWVGNHLLLLISPNAARQPALHRRRNESLARRLGDLQKETPLLNKCLTASLTCPADLIHKRHVSVSSSSSDAFSRKCTTYRQVHAIQDRFHPKLNLHCSPRRHGPAFNVYWGSDQDPPRLSGTSGDAAALHSQSRIAHRRGTLVSQSGACR